MSSSNTVPAKKQTFSVAIATPSYQEFINNTLKDPERAKRFIASITSAVAITPALQTCTPLTILAAGLTGEALNLSPSPQLGQYYLVPFKQKAKYDRSGNLISPECVNAQFVLGYKGYAAINIAANQNIPSRAAGSNLDALAELVWAKERPNAQKATCTVRFAISESQVSAILIPAGTRVTDASRALFWTTHEDVYIPIGATSAEVPVYCETAGTVGNDYVVGQINTIVDLFPYYSSCTNITVSGGGSDAATDEEFYEMLRASMDAYSTAGPVGAYTYWAKSVSTEIADVKAIRPKRAIEKNVPVYDGHAFLGGDNLDLSTLVVSKVGGSAPARAGTDYTATYIDGLLDLRIYRHPADGVRLREAHRTVQKTRLLGRR